MTNTDDAATAEAARKRQAEQDDAAKKVIAEQRETRERQQKEATERSTTIKPTPTQEENDLAALGMHVVEKENDGSGPEVTPQRNLNPESPRPGYRTRAVPQRAE